MTTLRPPLSLFAAPPALRSEIARRALLSQEGRNFAAPCPSTALLCVLREARGYHRPRIGHIRTSRVPLTEVLRFQSTFAGTNTTTEAAAAFPDPPPPKSRLQRVLTTATLILIFTSAGFLMAAAPHAEAINGYLNPPKDEDTLALYIPPNPTAEEINEHILSHPLAVKLRAQEGIVESRPHMKIPPAMRPYNLTGGTLIGEGKIEVPPLNFADKDAELPTLVQLVYVGPAMCGHPGIVHGGLLATLLDEGLARACFPALPNKVGVTASLKIDYRVPCPASSYLVLKAQTTKVEGRKAWVEGRIELLGGGDGDDGGEGTKIVEAEALFIEPKGAKTMARVYSSQ